MTPVSRLLALLLLVATPALAGESPFAPGHELISIWPGAAPGGEHATAKEEVVERAKGILQHRQGLTEEEAYLRLRNESRRLRRPMKDLAEAIILSEDLARKSED